MKTSKRLLKINTNGELVESTDNGIKWSLTSRPWSWNDISPGYKLSSKKNYKQKFNI